MPQITAMPKKVLRECHNCGANAVTKCERNIRRTIDGCEVTIENVPVEECYECREYVVSSEDLAIAEREMALALLKHRKAVGPQVAAFARKAIGFTQQQLDRFFGGRAAPASVMEMKDYEADNLMRLALIGALSIEEEERENIASRDLHVGEHLVVREDGSVETGVKTKC